MTAPLNPLARIARKITAAYRLLRYGPSRLERLEAMLDLTVHGVATSAPGPSAGDAAAGRLEARVDTLLEGRTMSLHQRLDELTRAVVAKAADADLQFVRESLIFDLRREADWLRDRLTALGGQVDRLAASVEASTTGGAQGEASGAPDKAHSSEASALTRAALGQKPEAPAASRTPPSASAAEAAFYPALEKHFRGTREELQARLGVYRPWIDGAPAGRIADIGCGRGEWMELLAQWGRDVVGVDANEVLVHQGRERGLAMEQGDAIAWLAAQPDGSLAAVTSFHVVEHLPFGVLLALVDQARRVLVPGGVLVLETPNPENLSVSTQSFWTDPTHQRPIPPLLLEFIVQHAGLQVLSVPRLNPPDDAVLAQAADPALRAMLGQGRDYAVIGRKAAA